MSPAREHKLKVLAAKNSDIDLNAAEPYQKLQIQLRQHRALLKEIKGVPDKITEKRRLIDAYRPWLQEVYASGRANPTDTVFTTALLWLIDIGELDTAAPLAEFAIAQNMVTADEYQRDLPDLIYEEFAQALSSGDAELAAETENNMIRAITAINAETGLHSLNVMDQIRAKFLKACGERAEEAEDLSRALDLYEQALAYNPRAGVKKAIESIKKQMA